MTDTYLSKVILFNNLHKEDRVSFLYAELKKKGFSPKIQDFFSSFGEGRNIFAEINNDDQKKNIVLSAHYDGESLFDNAGGVIALLDLSKRIQHLELPFSVGLLFTDQEENYQQGAAHFIKKYITNNNKIIHKNINIDGFGIGDELFAVSDLTKNSNNDKELFLCDGDEFIKNNIPSINCFSAFIEDFRKAKLSNDILYSFRKYKTDKFYQDNFDKDKYKIIGEKLWLMIHIL